MSESKYIGANVATQTDTFASWIERTNQMVYDMSTVVITTFANSTGGQTTGNAHVNGFFSANTLIAKDETKTKLRQVFKSCLQSFKSFIYLIF